MLIIEVPKLANPKSITSESKAYVVVMQAVCLLNGPLCERRRSAQTDRVTTRRGATFRCERRHPVLQAQLEGLDQDPPQIQERPITEWDMHWDRKKLSHEAEDRLTVEAFHPGAGRKFALSAVIAVSVATAVQCVRCGTLFSAPKLRSSNKRCNNLVVEDSVAKHRKQRDKKLNWAVHVVCRCVWRMRLFCTPLDKPEKMAKQRYKHDQH